MPGAGGQIAGAQADYPDVTVVGAGSATEQLWASTLDALMDAAAAILTADSLQETLHRVAERLEGLVPYEDLAIYEVDRVAGMFVPLFAHGTYTEEVMADPFPLDKGISGVALRTGQVQNIERGDLHATAAVIAGTPVIPEAMICVPLGVGGQTIAMLNVYRPGEHAGYSDHEALVIERFGIIVALALDSARQRDRLRAQAQTDDLTGLLNRRAFNQRLEMLLSHAHRDGRPLGLVVIDIDHFKRVNDRHGHETGDTVLAAVAEVLTASVREADLVARLGGEEFALILPGSDGPASAAIAERARHRLAAHAPLDLAITLSAGVAGYPMDGEQAAELMRAADSAMYDAKRAGRNRVYRAAG